jgi:L-fucose isomerase-like protein
MFPLFARKCVAFKYQGLAQWNLFSKLNRCGRKPDVKLSLITIRSAIHDTRALEKAHSAMLDGLRRKFELEFVEPSEAAKVKMPVVFVASGGCEGTFKDLYPFLPQPILLLADGLHNSLAAALEILSWVHQMDGKAEIIHGNGEYVTQRIKAHHKRADAKKALSGHVIGMIDRPSDWLIASSVDKTLAKERWGIAFKEIEIPILEGYAAKASESEARKVANDFMKKASGVEEPSKEEIIKAAKLYIALRGLAADHGLSALTVKCFGMLDVFKTTFCLALALLNDEGIISACEGDEQTAFTMLLLHKLTGETPFMANPSEIDLRKNEIILAHCTIAPSIAKRYVIRNHFESRIGVGIQGIFGGGRVTVAKIGNPDLGEFFVSSGKLVGDLNDPHRCRTQIKVRLDEDAGYFLKRPLANHHVVIRGDHAEAISDYLIERGVEKVR